MLKPLLLAAGLLCACASLASASGINLAWDDCGAAGATAKSFACTSNSGASTMYASYVPPPGIFNLVGNETLIDLQSGGATLPDWWKFGPTLCRTALSASFQFVSGPFTCADFWNGQATGGYDYAVGGSGPNRARLRTIAAVPSNLAGPVDPALEYYAVAITITNVKTTGTGACAGCATGVCVVLASMNVVQPAGYGDYLLTFPLVAQHVVWQPAGSPAPPACPAAVPALARTWGAVKALYR